MSPYAAPARCEDLAGLAAAYVEVGELDIFRGEALSYAGRLCAAGVSTELHVHPGAPHGYDIFVPECAVTQRAWRGTRSQYSTGCDNRAGAQRGPSMPMGGAETLAATLPSSNGVGLV